MSVSSTAQSTSSSARSRPSLAARIVWLALGSTLCVALVSSWASARAVGRFARVYVDSALPVPVEAAERAILDWYSEREAELVALGGVDALLQHVRSPSAATLADARASLRRGVGGFSGVRALALVRSSRCAGDPGDPTEGARCTPYGTAAVPELILGTPQPLGRIGSGPGPRRLRYDPVEIVGGERIQPVHVGLARGDAAWLVAWLHLDALDGLLAAAPHWVAAEVSLLGPDGRVLASTASERVGERRGEISSRAQEAQNRDGSPVHSYRDASGTIVLATTRHLGRFGFSLESRAPAAEILTPARAALQGTFFVYFGVVLLCCAVALILARSVVRPLRALASGAQRLADGEAIAGIEECGREDELGILVRTFNHMARTLERQRRALERGRARIEAANVDLRTRNEELEQLNARLERLSITDGLTGLYNHRYFQEHLSREIARVERSSELLALVLIDIDNFKQLNDRHGHAAGDAVLRKVAGVMRDLTRDSDLLARYGGEEFALVPRQTTLEGVVRISEKIRMGIAEAGVALPEAGTGEAGAKLQVTVSMGIGIYRGDRAGFFRAADRALYQAKGNGKDCVVVFE